MPGAKERERGHDYEELGFCLAEFRFYSIGYREPAEAFKQCPARR